MNIDKLLGKDKDSLKTVPGTKFLLHPQVIDSFLNLQSLAALDGIDLQLISAFRPYERQLEIWNSKARGERELLYDNGRIIDFNSLSPEDLMWTILRWSALPGASRHHWGTDFDVFDAATQKREDVKLLTSDWENGPSKKLNTWLTEKLQDENLGFFRPYEKDIGGVAPEPWHLSFKPLAGAYRAHYTYSVFLKNIEDSEILLKEEVLKNSKEIFQRFFI